MKISTKGRYALRLMLDIALNSGGKAVSLRDVARRQEISDKYLEQIVTPLSRAGLVRSVRGAGGVICSPVSRRTIRWARFSAPWRGTWPRWSVSVPAAAANGPAAV